MPWIATAFALAGLHPHPSNDDPFYAKPVYWACVEGRYESALQGGRLTASSAAHVAAGISFCQVFGWSFSTLCAACIVQQAFGAVSIYMLLCDLAVDKRTTMCGAAALMLSPWYFCHAYTFMTDGPACAWVCVALFAFVRGAVRRQPAWWCLGSVGLSWGMWIRQTDAVLVIVPLSILLIERLRRTWTVPFSLKMLGMLVPFAFALAALESGLLLESSVSRASDVLAKTPLGSRMKELVVCYYGLILLIGLFLLPLTPLWLSSAPTRDRPSVPGRPARNSLRHVCIAASTILLLTPLSITRGGACVTNSTGPFIQNGHLGPIFLSDMDEPGRWGELAGVAWPMVVWQSLTVAAVAVVVAAFTCLWDRLRCPGSRDSMERMRRTIITACVVTGCAYVLLVSLLVGAIMDRYWLFLLPLAVVVLLTAVGTSGSDHKVRGVLATAVPHYTCALLLAVVWLFNCVMIHDHWSWNHARWQQIDRWVQQGYAPESFDGGRDVNAWLRLDEDPHTHPRPGDSSPWWSGRGKWRSQPDRVQVGQRWIACRLTLGLQVALTIYRSKGANLSRGTRALHLQPFLLHLCRLQLFLTRLISMNTKWLDWVIETPWISDLGRNIVERGFVRHRQELRAYAAKCGGPVLDLGCGTGLLSGVFEANRYLGVDVNERMLKAARARNPRHRYMLSDGSTIPVTRHRFDLVVIVGVLHHLDDESALRLLREAARVLTVQGRIYVCEDVPARNGNSIGGVVNRCDLGSHIRCADETRLLLSEVLAIEEESSFVSGFMDYHTFFGLPAEHCSAPPPLKNAVQATLSYSGAA
ncbi:MAG: methyltransferase domain-containing protein [Pirellulales bacterium]